MTDDTDWKQVIHADMETTLHVFKNNLRQETEKIVACFFECFEQEFLKWALISYPYYDKDFITDISKNAFNDGIIMFTEKAAAGTIYPGGASMRTIVFSFYKWKLREAIQNEKRLLAKKSKYAADYIAEKLLLEDNDNQIAENMNKNLEYAMAQMEPTDRQIITWRHIEEKSNDEIAEKLAIQVPAATNRIWRCMRRLRSLMENNPDSDNEYK